MKEYIGGARRRCRIKNKKIKSSRGVKQHTHEGDERVVLTCSCGQDCDYNYRVEHVPSKDATYVREASYTKLQQNDKYRGAIR